MKVKELMKILETATDNCEIYLCVKGAEAALLEVKSADPHWIHLTDGE